METAKRTIALLAAGDFPTHSEPLRALAEADLIVCCDSAYASLSSFAPAAGKPFMVVGDGDSLPPDTIRRLGPLYHRESEQDFNDLTKAMRHIARLAEDSGGHAEVTIVGATGKREDHTLGNISLLAYYRHAFPRLDVRMLTDHGRLDAFSGERTFPSFPRQQVSIISLAPSTPVSASGLQWPLHEQCLRWWWEGTLNAALGDTFSVSGTDLIVFRSYEAKPLSEA